VLAVSRFPSSRDCGTRNRVTRWNNNPYSAHTADADARGFSVTFAWAKRRALIKRRHRVWLRQQAASEGPSEEDSLESLDDAAVGSVAALLAD
jgi:hypothetical protein